MELLDPLVLDLVELLDRLVLVLVGMVLDRLALVLGVMVLDPLVLDLVELLEEEDLVEIQAVEDLVEIQEVGIHRAEALEALEVILEYLVLVETQVEAQGVMATYAHQDFVIR